MAAFNLTAELNLRGPSNINQVIGNIRRQLSTLTLDLNIDPNTSRGVQTVTTNIRALSTALRDAQGNAAALSTTLSNLVTNINNAGNAASNAGNALNRLNTQTRAAQAAARDGATAMENFGAQSALAIRRFAAFSVGTVAIYSFTRALSSAYSEFVNFNKEFVRLQQVTNSSASGLAGLSQEITRLSTGLGVSSSELLTVSSTLAQAGLSASQTKTALEALAKSALAPSFDSLNETVEGSIALMRQFGLSAGDLESALGSINAVAAKFAVESSDIITAIQRTGGVFASASQGVSKGKDALNEFIAVFTSVRATTRESAETIATGLRTIFTRIQRGNTIQALKEYGITLTDLEGKFVGPYEAVRRLSEGLRALDPRDLRFSEIVEELGGFRQIGKVIPLIQQFATAQQALAVAQRGSGSLTGDAAKAQESLAIRVNKVREEFIALIRDIGQTQSFQKFVDISLQLASALISVASAAKEVLPAITAIAAIRAVPAIAQFAGGFGRGITRRNDGGPIRKFAAGGVVPGSGNRDTIPAMLTPGEFVIRKKAVEKIGVNNLARMNSGGEVQKFAQPIPRYNSGKVRNKPGRAEREIKKGMGNYQFGLVGLYTGAKTEAGFGYKNTTQIDLGEKYNNAKATLNTATISSQYGEEFSNSLEGSLKEQFTLSVTRIATSLASKLGSSPTKNQGKIERAINGSGFASVAGAALESAIALIGAPYLEKKEKTKSIDFPFGIGKAAGLFGINPRIPTDVTRTIGGVGKNEAQMKEQILRFLGAVEDGEFTKAVQEKVVSRNKSRLSGLLPTVMSRIDALGGGGKQLLSAAEIIVGDPELKYFPSGPNKNQLSKILREGGDPAAKELEEILRVAEAKKAGRPTVSRLLRNRKAMGGGISGQDTVPALLTPGEFVVNKKAAQRIGYSQLNRLNKADKVQGFNKGGAVGSIQTFADGGFATAGNIGYGVAAVAALGAITLGFRRLTSVIDTLSTSLRGFNRSVDMGLPRTGEGTRRGGPRPRDFTNQESFINRRGLSGRGTTFDALGIAFGGSAVASSVGDAVGGVTGKGVTAIGTAFSSVAGVVASFGMLTNPIGLLITGVVGATAAISAYAKATREATIEEEQKKIEARSATLEKSFEQIKAGKTPQSRDIATSTFLDALKENIKSESIIKKQEIQAASPLIGSSQETFANAFDLTKLGSRFSEIDKNSSEKILSFINEGLSQNQSLENILQRLESAGISRQTSQAAIGSASLRAPEIAQAQARVQANELADRAFFRTTDSESTQAAKRILSQLLYVASEEFKRFSEDSKKVPQATEKIISKLNLFAEAMKNVEAATNRASAEFSELQRQIDIGVGSKLGGRATIAQPSKTNEAVLENLRAYSPEEISRTINQFGQNLNLNPEFTQRAQGAALSQRVLQTDLPKILNSISEGERNAKFGETTRSDTIRNQLKGALEAGGVTDTKEIDRVVEDVITNIEKLGKGEITIDTIVSNNETFAKLFKTNSEVVQAYTNIMKSANKEFGDFVSRINEYSNAIEQSINTIIQASQIRAGGDIQLREALGERVTLGERNQLFNNEILGMTANIGADNRPIPGTGTTDPDEIARRLAAAEQRKRDLEAQATASGTQKFAGELSQVTTQINQYENALKKLANDTNRASNAMNEISRLRQSREARRESFLDFASNLGDPEYISNLFKQTGSLEAVMSGRGTLYDIQSAREGFQRRASAGFVDQAELEEQRKQLVEQVVAILERSIRGPLPQGLREQVASDFGALPQEQNAMKELKDANEARARATEIMGMRMEEGANYLFTKVKEAGDLWIEKVKTSTNVAAAQMAAPPEAPAPGAVPAGALGPRAGLRAKGGLIYANQGQYIDFQPQGTDTVPAMLTPGEFVVNAKATKKNLGLLKQINSGGKIGGFSKGGVVYLAGGGMASGLEADATIEEDKKKLKEEINAQGAAYAAGTSEDYKKDKAQYDSMMASYDEAKLREFYFTNSNLSKEDMALSYARAPYGANISNWNEMAKEQQENLLAGYRAKFEQFHDEFMKEAMKDPLFHNRASAPANWPEYQKMREEAINQRREQYLKLNEHEKMMESKGREDTTYNWDTKKEEKTGTYYGSKKTPEQLAKEEDIRRREELERDRKVIETGNTHIGNRRLVMKNGDVQVVEWQPGEKEAAIAARKAEALANVNKARAAKGLPPLDLPSDQIDPEKARDKALRAHQMAQNRAAREQRRMESESVNNSRMTQTNQQATLTPRQRAQQEKERRQQEFKDEKERRKQAAMANNPGFAARVGREEAKKQKEQTEAAQRFPNLSPADAMKAYRREKEAERREKVNQMNRDAAIFDRERAAHKASFPIEWGGTQDTRSLDYLLATEQAAFEARQADARKKIEERNQRMESERIASGNAIVEQHRREVEAKAKEKEAREAERKARFAEKMKAEEEQFQLRLRSRKEAEKQQSEQEYAASVARRDEYKRKKAETEDLAKESVAQYNAESILIDPITKRILNEDSPDQIQKQLDFYNDKKNKRLLEIEAARNKDSTVLAPEILDRTDNGLLTTIRDLEIRKRSLDIALSKFNSQRAQENEATQEEYERLKKADDSNKLRPQEAERYATLALQRGVKPADIGGGRTLQAERALRDAALGEENRKALEKEEFKAFKEKLRQERQTTTFDKVIEELAAKSNKAVGGGVAGKAVGFGVSLLGGVIDPTNFASPAGLGVAAGLAVDTAAPTAAAAVANSLGDKEGVRSAATQGLFTAGLGVGARTVASISAPNRTRSIGPGPVGPPTRTTPSVQPQAYRQVRVGDKYVRVPDDIPIGREVEWADTMRYRTDPKLSRQFEEGIMAQEALEEAKLDKVVEEVMSRENISDIPYESSPSEFKPPRPIIVNENTPTAKTSAEIRASKPAPKVSVKQAKGIEPLPPKITDISDPAQLGASIDYTTSRLAQYASSPEASARMMSELPDKLKGNIAGVEIDPNLSIKDRLNQSGSVAARGVRGRYNSRTKMLGFRTQQPDIPLIKHEIGHGIQDVTGQMSRSGVAEFQTKLGTDIESFLQSKEGLDKLYADLGRKGYSKENIMKESRELFTTLLQFEDTDAFRNNPMAQDMMKKIVRSMGYKNGGLIYASKGTLVPYQPRGTDTVPAMLTPGEFVVNKQATQRNLPLLKAINNNSQYMNKGGKVSYFADGGQASGSMGAGGVSSFSLDSSAFSDAVGTFGTSVSELKTVLGNFGDGAGTLAKSATDLASAFGGISTSAGALSAAASILQGATQGLASPIAAFTSSIDRISSTLNNMKDINVNITGSIPPISIVVEVNGGDGLKDELKPFADEIYSKIGRRLAQATNGLFKIETTS